MVDKNNIQISKHKKNVNNATVVRKHTIFQYLGG